MLGDDLADLLVEEVTETEVTLVAGEDNVLVEGRSNLDGVEVALGLRVGVASSVIFSHSGVNTF